MNRGLNIVGASYGKVMAAHWSVISVRHKGLMDMGLWHQLLKDVYVPLYKGRLSPEPIRDPVTMKLLSGLLIVKMDAGPGRLSKQAISVDFREEMAQLGCIFYSRFQTGHPARLRWTSCSRSLSRHAAKARFVWHRRRCRRE